MSNRLSNLRNLSGEQLFGRATEFLPPWVTLILVLAIAWQLVRITWLFFPNNIADGAALPDEPTVATRTTHTDKSYDIGRIVAANLFGTRSAIVVPPPDDFEELDDTQLNLILRGTIAAGDDELALAIIADDNGEEHVYSIGDPIGGGRKLHSVLPDQAILNHNGELEALRLPKEYESKTPASSGSRQGSRPSTNRSAAIRNAQQTIANNPAKLTDLIRPQPVFSNGKQLGYRVYPGRRRQQFVSLGLKPGDLVTEINGTPLDDPAKGADIFRSLADSSQVTVTVERNGSPEVLVLDTEQLNLQGGQQQ